MTKEKMLSYSFQPAWEQVLRLYGKEKRDEIKAALMEAMNISSIDAWYKRKRGVPEPKFGEKVAIEEIFRRNKIRHNIWGYETTDRTTTDRAADAARA